MNQPTRLLAVVLCLAGGTAACPQDRTAASDPKVPDGVYAVYRDGLKEKDVLPLKDGEVLLVHRHRYARKDAQEPPRFLVVRSAPQVKLDLVGKPMAVKEGDEVVRILLKLQPEAATALEKLTRAHLGRQLAVVVGGEVATTHTVRTVIKGGDVQISSCATGAAGYLLEQLKPQPRKK
jgi:preprotein translocase subunit SecD